MRVQVLIFASLCLYLISTHHHIYCLAVYASKSKDEAVET